MSLVKTLGLHHGFYRLTTLTATLGKMEENERAKFRDDAGVSSVSLLMDASHLISLALDQIERFDRIMKYNQELGNIAAVALVSSAPEARAWAEPDDSEPSSSDAQENLQALLMRDDAPPEIVEVMKNIIGEIGAKMGIPEDKIPEAAREAYRKYATNAGEEHLHHGVIPISDDAPEELVAAVESMPEGVEIDYADLPEEIKTVIDNLKATGVIPANARMIGGFAVSNKTMDKKNLH